MKKEDIIELYNMKPHPEGGKYRELWQSPVMFQGQSSASLTYYLLEKGEKCLWHRLRSQEIWLWHAGAELVLYTGGTGDRPQEETGVTLGKDLFHKVISADTWQRAKSTGDFTLVSCVVTPGYRDEDWEILED